MKYISKANQTHLPRAPAAQVILSAAVGSVELLPVSCRCSHNPWFLKMCMGSGFRTISSQQQVVFRSNIGNNTIHNKKLIIYGIFPSILTQHGCQALSPRFKDTLVQQKLDEVEERLRHSAAESASRRQRETKEAQEKRLKQLVLEERSAIRSIFAVSKLWVWDLVQLFLGPNGHSIVKRFSKIAYSVCAFLV